MDSYNKHSANMSEIIERNEFAQNSITKVQPGFSFQDNNTADTYHGYNRHSAINQAYSDYLSIEQHDLQPSYDIFPSTSSISRQDRLQRLYQPLRSYVGQETMQHSTFLPQGDIQSFRDNDLRYSPCEQYSDSNAASPTQTYFPQVGTGWEDRLHYEGDLNQRSLFNGNGRIPVANQAQAVVGRIEQGYKNEPYAKLIFLALRSAPEHKMALKDIYSWFESFTDKTQPGSKGWQNSIRHNLSMNIVSKSSDFRTRTNKLQAFQKEESGSDSGEGKRSYVWSLSKEALEQGFVESTTRFRKPLKKKSPAQPAYRVSKASAATVTRPTLSPRYLLQPYDHLWNDTRRQYGLEEEQVLQPLTPAWSHESPYGLPQATYQHQSYQPTPNYYFPLLHPESDYEATGRALTTVEDELAAAFPRPLEERCERQARPFDLDEEEQDSPTPSLATTNSSFSYHEMTEEERYHLHQSHDFSLNILHSGNQSYDRSTTSSTNPYSTRYE